MACSFRHLVAPLTTSRSYPRSLHYRPYRPFDRPLDCTTNNLSIAQLASSRLITLRPDSGNAALCYHVY
eukprot:2158655-Amphidinium_carterae.1